MYIDFAENLLENQYSEFVENCIEIDKIDNEKYLDPEKWRLLF